MTKENSAHELSNVTDAYEGKAMTWRQALAAASGAGRSPLTRCRWTPAYLPATLFTGLVATLLFTVARPALPATPTCHTIPPRCRAAQQRTRRRTLPSVQGGRQCYAPSHTPPLRMIPAWFLCTRLAPISPASSHLFPHCTSLPRLRTTSTTHCNHTAARTRRRRQTQQTYYHHAPASPRATPHP